MTEKCQNPARLRGFAPVWDNSARVLILGSMPSEASLAAGHYYAHPANRFWSLAAALFPAEREALTSEDFEERYRALCRSGVALWDTIGECERTGSLDSAIRALSPNDIVGLLRRAPGIRLVILNGRKSEAVWKRHALKTVQAEHPGVQWAAVPSTSPANARLRLDDLIREWQAALKNAGIA